MSAASKRSDVRAALGPRGSVVFVARLSGDAVRLRMNWVRELPNGHLSELHQTHEHERLEEGFAEILQAVRDEELLAEHSAREGGS
jgi:transposase-like protein